METVDLLVEAVEPPLDVGGTERGWTSMGPPTLHERSAAPMSSDGGAAPPGDRRPSRSTSPGEGLAFRESVRAHPVNGTLEFTA